MPEVSDTLQQYRLIVFDEPWLDTGPATWRIKLMSLHHPLILATFSIAIFGLIPAASASDVCPSGDVTVAALPYSGTGCFSDDDYEQSFLFTADSTASFDLFTTSWAAGGFAPELTLFDGTGAFIASDFGGTN